MSTTESGKATSTLRVFDLRPGQALRHHHQRHVAHHLGRGRDLDDVAEHLVGIGIGLRHLVPALLQPQAAGLRLEVGELAAGHLVQVDLGGRGLQAGLEGRILLAHAFPVVEICRIAPMSRPVSRSVWRSASTMDPRQGCEVPPENASIAASTASTPASQAARMVAAAAPLVSWVWKWIGSPTSCFSALTRTRAAAGFSSPAMSFSPSTWAPADFSSFARST
jgi:hypothetical protein